MGRRYFIKEGDNLGKQKRQDGFVNTVIGHGQKNRDPLSNRRYMPDRFVSDGELASMYWGNSLVRRIIDLPAEEAVKNWIKVCGDQEEFAIQMHDDLKTEEHAANALRWSRLFGGSVILMAINDGGTLEDELRENDITEIEGLRVYDKREVIILDTGKGNYKAIMNDDIRSKFYGTAEWIYFNPSDGTQPFYAHRSRVLFFDGESLPNHERLMRQGWGMPTMQGIVDDVGNNEDAYRISRLILERMSQSVTKLDGLLEKLETDEGEEIVKKRLYLIDMARSILDTIAIDVKDEFEIHNISLTNLPEMIDRFGLFLCAKTGIPFTVLFGRSPAGLNSTGQSDNEIFYSLVRRLQKRRLKGNLDRLTKLLMLSKRGLFRGVEPENWKIECNPIWHPSEKEQAETRKANADADKAEAETAQIYNVMNALDGSEVRTMLAADSKYSEHMDGTLDMSGEGMTDDGTGEE